ncbi:MAG: class I SAM-dependent methyltransferase [Candidatus Saccharibacteria bacterium]
MPKSRKRPTQKSRPTAAKTAIDDKDGATLAPMYDSLYRKHARNPVATPGITGFGEEFLKPKSSILDLGSGVANALTLARLGHKVTAYDLSPVAVRQLNQAAEIEGLDLRAEVYDICRGIHGSYDMVLMLAVLHHLLPDEAARVISQAKLATKPGGFHYLRVLDKSTGFWHISEWQKRFFTEDTDALRAFYSDWSEIMTLVDRQPSEERNPVMNSYVVMVTRRPQHITIHRGKYQGASPTTF